MAGLPPDADMPAAVTTDNPNPPQNDQGSLAAPAEDEHAAYSDSDLQASAQSDMQPMTTSIHRHLSPVSPRPTHVAEPSNIPLLMDPDYSSAMKPEEPNLDVASSMIDPG